MKKIFLIALGVASLFSATGCKDLLDVTPKGSYTTDTFFQNDAQAEAAIESVYWWIDEEECTGREFWWAQCCGTMCVPGRIRSYPSLFTMTWNGDESPLRTTYEYIYEGVAKANWVVQQLVKKSKETTLTAVESRSLGEAYCARAYYQFCIAYRYGTADQGVPAIKYEECAEDYNYEIPTQQASVIDNYKMIIADLQKAEELLSDVRDYSSEELGRVSKQSAVGLMVRVYAYWAAWDDSQWSNVKAAVDKLETTYGRGLNPSYSELFGTDMSTWNNKEICWSCPGSGANTKSGFQTPGVVLENKGWGVVNGWGQFKPSYDCYEEFKKDGDKEVNERLRRSILEYGTEFTYNGEPMKYYGAQDVETGFQINKWMDCYVPKDFEANGYGTHGGRGGRTNQCIVRFADCLLFRAEANLHLGNPGAAATDINAIRKRAGLSENAKGTWEEIYHERICELSFEFIADHSQDLKRWALSGPAEIKALAINELESHPRALYHVWRDFPDSPVGKGVNPNGTIECSDGKTRTNYESIDLLDGNGVGAYEDYQGKEAKWDAHLAVFPYPSLEITKSAGALKQNAGY